MKISVFVHTANPAVDRPLRHMSKSRVTMLVLAGTLKMISDTAAQYLADRPAFVDAPIPRVSEIGYDRAARHGHALVWVPSGLTWQMKPTYGSMSRHFRQTRNGMNFAPNRTSSPRDHQASA